MKLNPIGKGILVSPLKDAETDADSVEVEVKSHGDVCIGEVVAVGSLISSKHLNVGDKVFYFNSKSVEIKYDNKDYHAVKDYNIIAHIH